ncbi:hypothetical protein GCM10010302_65990 [Streptomyces polychromogenes]|uniref:Uncharacterized protein n=1 Tax=Streptomyces polychromogenes TaxID=67342 RepID=A0ABP3FKY7_9ACTN
MDPIIARQGRSRHCVPRQGTERQDSRGSQGFVRSQRTGEAHMSAIKTSAKQFKYVMGAMTSVFFSYCSVS